MMKLESPKIAMDSIEEYIEKTIPDLYALVTTDKAGELSSYFVSEECSKQCDLDKLKEIARLVSIRFNIGNFQYLNGSNLEVTINVFDEFIMLVRSFGEDKILAVMVPKKIENLEYTLNTVRSFDDSKFKRYPNFNNSVEYKSEKLQKVPSTITEFQKNQQIYYNSLEPGRYILVAEPYLDSPTEEKDTQQLEEEMIIQ